MERHVTGPQRLAVRVVGLCPGISPGALADVLHLHPSTLTGILLRLERGGLLTRQANAADGRRHTLHLTRAGQTLNDVRLHTIEDDVGTLLHRLTGTEIACSRDVLNALADHLENCER